jgi:hypothetical protein
MFVEGGVSHVYNRFARRADLFSEPEEVNRWMSRGAEMRLSSRGFLEKYEALDQTPAGRGEEPALRRKERSIVGLGTVAVVVGWGRHDDGVVLWRRRLAGVARIEVARTMSF